MNLQGHLRVTLPALLVFVFFLVFFLPGCSCSGKPAPQSRPAAASPQSSQTEASSAPAEAPAAATTSAPPAADLAPPPPHAEKPDFGSSRSKLESSRAELRSEREYGLGDKPLYAKRSNGDHDVQSEETKARLEAYLRSQRQTEMKYEPHSNQDFDAIIRGSHPSVGAAAKSGTGSTAANSGANYAVVKIFYATDRRPTGVDAPGKFYGGDRQLDESLHLGTVNVSIPRDHRMGNIERPSIWRLEFRPDPEKHVVLVGIQPRSEQEFYSELEEKVVSSANKDAFVFVHGFDNTFEDAAERTAQMSYDLGFQGAAIMYSWPSKGKLAEYTADESTIDWTTPHLERFLETLAAQSHATTVHLIAHSMGNRALTRALFAIAERHADVLPMFKHVFLAAPDIDVGVFRQLAATFPSAANDVTLYASSRDEAIMASEKVHQFDRVGDSTHICVMPRIDTIDASAVDTGLIGHAYFGDKRSILTDMFEVIQNGSPPGKRFGMHSATFGQMTYWVLSP